MTSVADGAYASDALLARCAGLTSRDAGLASEIVFGCLRFQAQLDFLIGRYSGRSPAGQDALVLAALRAGIYQMRYLDRIPAHAAVNDSVEFIKTRRRKAAGFVNAVMRKVTRAPVQWPDEATALSCPAWLLDRWSSHFGTEAAHKIAVAALHEPGAYIRVPDGEQPPGGSLPTSVAGCFRLDGGNPEHRRLHDISSQAVVPLLALEPHHRYLDLCAAPGNKTLQALEAKPRFAVACDVSERRLRTVPPVCPRIVLNAEHPLPFRSTPEHLKFDRIFIDAPCSGTGTLARNPEIKWRVQRQDPGTFGRKQARIVLNALDALATRGRLVYATCSLEREENEDVIAAVLDAAQQRGLALRLTDELWRIPGRDEGDGFYAAVLEL